MIMRIILLISFLLALVGCSEPSKTFLCRAKIADLPSFPDSPRIIIKYKPHSDAAVFWANLAVAEKDDQVLSQAWLSSLKISVLNDNGTMLWECSGVKKLRITAGLSTPIMDCSEGYDKAIDHVDPNSTYTIIVSIESSPKMHCPVPFALYSYERRRLSFKDRLFAGIIGQEDDIILLYDEKDLPSKGKT